MAESVVIFGILISMVLAVFGVVIALGVVVYKDAKALGLNAWGWTLLSVFAPNFIGLIIYLIVRHGVERKMYCSSCQVEVKEDYNVCPNCQATFERTCGACGHGVKADMSYCPYCGSVVTEEDSTQPTARKCRKERKIAKPLMIIGGVYLVIMIALMGSMVTFAIADSESNAPWSDVSVGSISTQTMNKMKASFQYRVGTATLTEKMQLGDTQLLDVNIGVQKGTLTLRVKAPNGKIVYEKEYNEGDYQETVSILAEEEGKYKFTIICNAAKGSYEITKL